MAVYEVAGNPARIDYGATGVDEILQNVRMILTTTVLSVPLDREFGIDFSIVDQPTEAARARLRAEIYTKIRRYEPRAAVKEVAFVESALDLAAGRLIPRVVLEAAE